MVGLDGRRICAANQKLPGIRSMGAPKCGSNAFTNWTNACARDVSESATMALVESQLGQKKKIRRARRETCVCPRARVCVCVQQIPKKSRRHRILPQKEGISVRRRRDVSGVWKGEERVMPVQATSDDSDVQDNNNQKYRQRMPACRTTAVRPLLQNKKNAGEGATVAAAAAAAAAKRFD